MSVTTEVEENQIKPLGIFSQELVRRAQEHFSKKANRPISESEANEILFNLQGFGMALLKHVAREGEGR